MKVTPRLPVHQKYAQSQDFLEMRYFRFEQRSSTVAALFGLYEELRHPHFSYIRKSLLQGIEEKQGISYRQILRFLLEPRVREEYMVDAWNCEDRFADAVITATCQLAGVDSSQIGYLFEYLRNLVNFQFVIAGNQPEINPMYVPTIYMSVEEQHTVLLYPGRSLDSFLVTHCGHIHVKANVFARMRAAMGKPMTQDELQWVSFPCEVGNCRVDIGNDVFDIGREAAHVPHIHPLAIYSDIALSNAEIGKYIREKPEGTSVCRYCGVRNGTLPCHENCLICQECAVVAYCSYGYCLRCPACGERLSKQVCLHLAEIAGKFGDFAPQNLPYITCDYCQRGTLLMDMMEIQYENRMTFACSNCAAGFTPSSDYAPLASTNESQLPSSPESALVQLPKEEAKERSCQCEECGTLRGIQHFKFYLSGQHSCLICDPCYHSFLLTEHKKFKCSRCPQAYTSQDAKKFMKLTSTSATFPSIWCAICLRQNPEHKFSVAMRLSHWWKCRICDDCLIVRYQQSEQICPACSSLYSFQDLAIRNQTIPTLISQRALSPTVPTAGRVQKESGLRECQMCGRDSSEYSIMKAMNHGCQVCDNCVDALYDSNWVPECPNCHTLVRSGNLKQITCWKNSRNSMPEMNTPRTCSICTREKLRREMLKSDRLHHTCIICDECLISHHRLTACPKCSEKYGHQDKGIMAKLLGRIPVESRPSPSPGSVNQKSCGECRGEISTSRPQCLNVCLCSLCILKNYFFTNSKNCSKCQSPIKGKLPGVVFCTGCSRQLIIATENSDAVSGVCDNHCVLCCFCITISGESATCKVCKSQVESIELKQIAKWQNKFKLGCYCGKDTGAKVKISCGCKVHSECWPKLQSCRKCGHEYKKKTQLVRLNSYLT